MSVQNRQVIEKNKGYWGEGRGRWELVFNGHRVSVWEDEKVLAITNGGCR